MKPSAISLQPEWAGWNEQLRRLAKRPLGYCDDFPMIASRHEAWWQRECIDRPVFLGSANLNPLRPITRQLELLDKPDEWLAAKQMDLQQTHRVGDTLPVIRVDFGPVMLSGLLGGQVEFQSDTTWTHAFIQDDWSNAPNWSLPDNQPWWQRLQELTTLTALNAAGKHLVMTPDLGGSADVLLNLRGSSELCLDAIERPELVRQHIDAIYPAWRRVFTELYRRCVGNGAGLTHWLGLWSNHPYLVPACDFNFMIGPAEFERICLPDIARQAATVGQAVFHLDGPGAARHIDALLELPELQAIQFTPGEGTPSALAWVDMFRKILNSDRAILVFCPPAEVLELCEALPPEGLAIQLNGAITPGDLDDLFKCFNQRYHP